MFGWLHRKKSPEPLVGAPSTSRLKTYSAQSGYVYQYFYRGRRPARGEYVFEIARTTKAPISVSVFLQPESILSWERGHGRELTPTEHYAAAKMALFQAFDERESPAEMARPVHVRPADLEAILETLGLD